MNPPFRHSIVRFLTLAAAGTLAGACHRQEAAVDLAPQVEELKAELETTRGKLVAAEKSLAEAQAEVAAAGGALESAKIERAERDQVITQRDTQLLAAQAENESFKKKRDIFAFAEIRALQQQGATLTAMSRYRQFLRDFPNSPLAADANIAIAELTTEAQSSPDLLGGSLFPTMQRENNRTLDYFRDGLLTPQELAPLLKKKSRNQVVGMLGRPNFNFPDGKEIGYNDKGTNPVTGKRGMLIITFESDEVAYVRVDYAGRPVKP